MTLSLTQEVRSIDDYQVFKRNAYWGKPRNRREKKIMFNGGIPRQSDLNPNGAMVAFVLLLFIQLASPKQVSVKESSSVIKELVTEGWQEYELSDARVQISVLNIAVPQLTLTEPRVAVRGDLRVVNEPLSAVKALSVSRHVVAVHENMTLDYNYHIDVGNGVLNVKSLSRTYTMDFVSSFGDDETCKTHLHDFKLKKEGPVEITASGSNSVYAVVAAEKIRHLLTDQSRKLAYFSIIGAILESIEHRTPNLCP